MPNRIVREGILTSVKVNQLSSGAELFYRRMLNVVDDFGRYHGMPALLRAATFPLKLDKVLDSHISDWLAESVKAGLVETYLFDGLPYIEILNFGTPRAKESKFKRLQTDASRCSQTQTDANIRTVVVVDSVVEVVGVCEAGAEGQNQIVTPAAHNPPVPNFRATFLAAYPECPNKRYSTEAENYWAMLTDAQRAKCMDSVNAYATAVLAAPKSERKWAVKPETWLTGFGPEFDSEACKTFDRGPPASDNVSESFKRPAGYFKPRM